MRRSRWIAVVVVAGIVGLLTVSNLGPSGEQRQVWDDPSDNVEAEPLQNQYITVQPPDGWAQDTINQQDRYLSAGGVRYEQLRSWVAPDADAAIRVLKATTSMVSYSRLYHNETVFSRYNLSLHRAGIDPVYGTVDGNFTVLMNQTATHRGVTVKASILSLFTEGPGFSLRLTARPEAVASTYDDFVQVIQEMEYRPGGR